MFFSVFCSFPSNMSSTKELFVLTTTTRGHYPSWAFMVRVHFEDVHPESAAISRVPNWTAPSLRPGLLTMRLQQCVPLRFVLLLLLM